MELPEDTQRGHQIIKQIEEHFDYEMPLEVRRLVVMALDKQGERLNDIKKALVHLAFEDHNKTYQSREYDLISIEEKAERDSL